MMKRVKVIEWEVMVYNTLPFKQSALVKVGAGSGEFLCRQSKDGGTRDAGSSGEVSKDTGGSSGHSKGSMDITG